MMPCSLRRFLLLLVSAFKLADDNNVLGFVTHLPAASFSVLKQRQHSYDCTGLIARYAKESNSNSDGDDGQTATTSQDLQALFPGAKVEDFVLSPHRPLGLTVEESLADSQYVFVTKISEGGYAEAAGLKVGDTLLQVTGVFGDLSPVVGVGVEKLKGMVASRPEEEALEIQVARGTDVLDEHEKAVIEFCNNASSDQEVEQCVIDYLSMEYNEPAVAPPSSVSSTKDDNNDEEDDDGDTTKEEEEDDANNKLDNLFDMWAEDLPAPVPQPPKDLATEKPKEKVKPWSSRSSPSGTFVRDPVTGKMRNIDA